MRKLLCLVLMFIMIFSIPNVTSIRAKINEGNLHILEVQRTQAEKIHSFGEFYNENINNDDFIKSYSGVYFESSNLIISVVRDYSKTFMKTYDLDFQHEINFVKYSMIQLEEFEEYISTMSTDLKLLETSIDVRGNKVNVKTELTIEEFLSNIDKKFDPSIVSVHNSVYEIDYKVNRTDNGERFSVGTVQCTVGFAVEDNNNDAGFVTAGHCMENSGASNGTNVYYDSSHAGDVDGGWHFEDGDVDGGFVELRYPLLGTKWLPSHNLVFGGSYFAVGTFSSFFVPGTIVNFHGTFGPNGTVNTTVDSGEILNGSINVYNDQNQLMYTNMVSTDIETQNGDSGGPLTITIYIGEGCYETNVLGILSFTYNDDSYYSKASDILDVLNLDEYS